MTRMGTLLAGPYYDMIMTEKFHDNADIFNGAMTSRIIFDDVIPP